MALSDGLNLLAQTAALSRGQRIETRRYWATVVAGAGAVHVVLDADPSGTAREASANAVGAVALGDRVQVEMRGRRLTIVQSPTSDTGWQPIPLASGWEGGAGVYEPAWRVKGGVVYLRGWVKPATGDLPAAFTRVGTLPPAARPAESLGVFVCASPGSASVPPFVTVTSSGDVLVASAETQNDAYLRNVIYPLT